MKPFAAQSFYELLEISVSATAPEIRAAWERLNRMYADDQVALYGLASADTAAALRKRLGEAVEVLTDDELRGMYDDELGLPPREPTIEQPQRQLELGMLLEGADRAVASTEPLSTEAPAAPVPPAPTSVAPPRREEAEHLSEQAALSMLPRPSPAPIPPPAPERPRLPEIPADAEYNGELLRMVRTSLGLSLGVVAERTRIGSKHLENVEADRYDALPATVYLRGILISLARELRLDGLKVARSYLALVERIRSKG